MSNLCADYEDERRAFDALLAPGCQERILLLCGTSGSGKTNLLVHCLQRAPEKVSRIPIQLRGSAVGVAEIFYRSGDRLSWKQFPKFTEQVADLQGVPRVQIDRNWLAGINNRISIALKAENPVDREDRRVALTGAWFDDLRDADSMTLISLDTYEQGTTEVQEWISGPFLARAAHSDNVRVLIAGQTIPESNNIEWGHCCSTRHLYGVPEARHWLPIVEAMGRHIPFGVPLDWLAGVCHALNGRPKDIMQVIEGLPRRGQTR